MDFLSGKEIDFWEGEVKEVRLVSCLECVMCVPDNWEGLVGWGGGMERLMYTVGGEVMLPLFSVE